MSSQSAGFADTSHAAASSEKGGSPSESDREGDEDVEELVEDDVPDEEPEEAPSDETGSEGEEAGSEPAASTKKPEREEVSPPADEEKESLRQQLADRQAVIDDIAEMMERDPELAAKLGRPSSNGSSENDYYREAEEASKGLAEGSREILLRTLEKPLRRLAVLERRQAEIDRRTGSMSQTLGSAEYESAFSKNSISAKDRQQPGFRKIEQDVNRRFKSLPSSERVEVMAAKWRESARSQSTRADAKSRFDTARASAGATMRRAGGSSAAERVIRIARVPGGGHVDKAAELRERAAKAGKPLPKIEYTGSR